MGNMAIAVKEVSLGDLSLTSQRTRSSKYIELLAGIEQRGFAVLIADKNSNPASAVQTALKKAERTGLIVKPYRPHSCVVLTEKFANTIMSDNTANSKFQADLKAAAKAEYIKHGFTVK